MQISSETISKTVEKLCFLANTKLQQEAYKKCVHLSNIDSKYSNIVENANLARKTGRPLCQDCGQVVLFVKLGQNVQIKGQLLSEAINIGIEEAYSKNYFRKSTVKDAIFKRENQNNNLPGIVHVQIVSGNSIEIDLIIKGAGCENKSFFHMFCPNSNEDEIVEYISERILLTEESCCPPLFLGIGIGGTVEQSCILAKESFFEKKLPSIQAKKFIEKLQKKIDSSRKNFVLGIKMKSCATHIASLPVAVSINCHSLRKASCKIFSENKIKFFEKEYEIEKISQVSPKNTKKILTNEIDRIRNLKKGEKILLSGTILTARDAAHKKLYEYHKKHNSFPIEIKDKIIFYCGPCPKKKDEVIGPLGPTTSNRMDTFAPLLYENKLLGTIGKGERSASVASSIKKNKSIHFSMQGGISILVQQCIKSCETVLYDELGPEAIYKLEVENLPLTVEISN